MSVNSGLDFLVTKPHDSSLGDGTLRMVKEPTAEGSGL